MAHLLPHVSIDVTTTRYLGRAPLQPFKATLVVSITVDHNINFVGRFLHGSKLTRSGCATRIVNGTASLTQTTDNNCLGSCLLRPLEACGSATSYTIYGRTKVRQLFPSSPKIMRSKLCSANVCVVLSFPSLWRVSYVLVMKKVLGFEEIGAEIMHGASAHVHLGVCNSSTVAETQNAAPVCFHWS